jgi:hypothetical protein
MLHYSNHSWDIKDCNVSIVLDVPGKLGLETYYIVPIKVGTLGIGFYHIVPAVAGTMTCDKTRFSTSMKVNMKTNPTFFHDLKSFFLK